MIICDRRTWKRYLIYIAIIFFAALSDNAIFAAGIKWSQKPYSHFAEKADIKDVLTDLFATQGVGIVFSENVNGSISGNFVDHPSDQFFKYIIDAYNLVWYYDGAAAYIYSANEMTSRVVNLNYVGMRKLKRDLTALDILDPKFALRMVEQERILYVAGPPRYVQLISELAKQLDAKAMAQRESDDTVNVFRLKYAWADDKIVSFRDRDMTLPGVATLLRGLLAGSETPGQMVQVKKRSLTTNLKKLKGHGLAQQKARQDEEHTRPDDGDHGQDAPAQLLDTEPKLGIVQADARQNAVVVRDKKAKMPYYRNIIALLDVPVGLVEIKATIMDVDRSNLEELGVQWEFTGSSEDGRRVTKGGANTTSLFSPEDGLQLPTGGGLNLATIIGDASDYFLARVHALEENGHAKILSRPCVLTLNNTEAQLEHSKTFFVRLSGNYEVDLYDVNAGVVLRVTPHIVEEKDQTLVKLAIQIEDSDILDEEVDGIPVVKRSVVNTQAVVGKNESLLIGGYIKERNVTGRQSVPCLGDIPVLGWMFRQQSDETEEFERLFLITPTVMPYGETNHLAALADSVSRFNMHHHTDDATGSVKK